jgi:hypothetical protein
MSYPYRVTGVAKNGKKCSRKCPTSANADIIEKLWIKKGYRDVKRFNVFDGVIEL